MRRTDTRPLSGERLSIPPGVGNGGEGCESSSANAQHHGGEGREFFPANAQHNETTAAPSAASSNMIADLVNALRQSLQMINEGGPTAPTAGTYESRPIEIRQKNEMLAWSGKLESGQSVGSAFGVFRGSVIPGSRLKG